MVKNKGNPMKTNTILQGDSLEVLKTFDDDSIDLIASDPPYQLDSINDRYKNSTLEKEHHKRKELEEGGKMGVYARTVKGFMGKEWDVLPQVPLLKECLRVLKAGAFSFWLMTPRQDSQAEFVIRLKQAGFNIGFTPLYWAYASGFPKAGNISKMVDKRMGVEFETKPAEGVGFMNENDDGYNTTKNQMIRKGKMSNEAKALDGSYAGYQPKPAVEIIIVAMKPLSEKTYIDQALKNNKGITWLDDVRVPYESNEKPKEQTMPDLRDVGKKSKKLIGIDKLSFNQGIVAERLPYDSNTQGRFPANLLVSDDVLGNEFSRYFNLDKLPKSVKEIFPFMIVPKASSGEKNDGLKGFEKKYMDESRIVGSKGGTNPRNRGAEKPRQNTHPTVKPTKLMEYLITLGSREGDLILDPFIGSGTTAIASRILSRKFIGIEKDKEYHKIALARIKEHLAQRKLFETKEDE